MTKEQCEEFQKAVILYSELASIVVESVKSVAKGVENYTEKDVEWTKEGLARVSRMNEYLLQFPDKIENVDEFLATLKGN